MSKMWKVVDARVPDESSMKDRIYTIWWFLWYNVYLYVYCTKRTYMNKPFFGYILLMTILNSKLRFLCPFLVSRSYERKNLHVCFWTKTTCEVSDASTMTPGHLLLTSLLKSKVLTPRKDRVNLCHLTTLYNIKTNMFERNTGLVLHM